MNLLKALREVLIEDVVPILVWAFFIAVAAAGIAAFAGVWEDRGPACVSETTPAGQVVCVPR